MGQPQQEQYPPQMFGPPQAQDMYGPAAPPPPMVGTYGTNEFQKNLMTDGNVDPAKMIAERGALDQLKFAAYIVGVSSLFFMIAALLYAFAGYRPDAAGQTWAFMFISVGYTIWIWALYRRHGFESLRASPSRSREFWMFYMLTTLFAALYTTWQWTWLGSNQDFANVDMPGCGKRTKCSAVPDRNPGPHNAPRPEAEAFATYLHLSTTFVIACIIVFIFAIRMAASITQTQRELQGFLRVVNGQYVVADPRDAPPESAGAAESSGGGGGVVTESGKYNQRGFVIQKVEKLRISQGFITWFWVAGMVFYSFMFYYTMHKFAASTTANPKISINDFFFEYLIAVGLFVLFSGHVFYLYTRDSWGVSPQERRMFSTLGGTYRYHWGQYFAMTVFVFALLVIDGLFYGHIRERSNTVLKLNKPVKFDTSLFLGGSPQPDGYYRYFADVSVSGYVASFMMFFLLTHLWLSPLLFPVDGFGGRVIISGTTRSLAILPGLRDISSAGKNGYEKAQLFVINACFIFFAYHALAWLSFLMGSFWIVNNLDAHKVAYTVFVSTFVLVLLITVAGRYGKFQEFLAINAGNPTGGTVAPGRGNEAVLIRMLVVSAVAAVQGLIVYYYIEDAFGNQLNEVDIRNPLTEVNTATHVMATFFFMQIWMFLMLAWDFTHTLGSPEIEVDAQYMAGIWYRPGVAAASSIMRATGGAAPSTEAKYHRL